MTCHLIVSVKTKKMKPLKHILIALGAWFVFTSCEKHEFPSTKITYPYEPEQETIIDVDVVPVGDVELEMEDMDLEVNADYFNRYGIGVRLHLKESTNDGIPMGKDGTITVYVVPMDFIKLEGVAAYTITYSSKQRKVSKIIMGEGFQTNRTLAHELGHAYGLSHLREKNNVMQLGTQAYQYDIPHNFNEKQIDTIMSNLGWYESK